MTAAKPKPLAMKPQTGRMPTLQFCRPAELHIDPAYQRDISGGASQALIRWIAQNWDWGLCQPLNVARRQSLTEQLYVVDGQHRLAAARLRGDIDQLPCVIVQSASAADEAASFSAMNTARKPLGKLDLFKAALAGGDARSIEIANALFDAGLSVARHTNYPTWKPGWVANIGGIEASWRRNGPQATTMALKLLAEAFDGEVLRYAGTIFPGVAALAVDLLLAAKAAGDDGNLEIAKHGIVAMLRSLGQDGWRSAIALCKADNPGMQFGVAAALTLRRHWANEAGAAAVAPAAPQGSAPDIQPSAATPEAVARRPAPPPIAQRTNSRFMVIDHPALDTDGRTWCAQCEARVTPKIASACTSAFCKAKAIAA